MAQVANGNLGDVLTKMEDNISAMRFLAEATGVLSEPRMVGMFSPAAFDGLHILLRDAVDAAGEHFDTLRAEVVGSERQQGCNSQG